MHLFNHPLVPLQLHFCKVCFYFSEFDFVRGQMVELGFCLHECICINSIELFCTNY